MPNCNTLQHTAAQCSTLQHTAAHCNTLHHTAPHCTTLHHTATHCNTVLYIIVAYLEKLPLQNFSKTALGLLSKQTEQGSCVLLQCVAVLQPVKHLTATRCNTLQHAATHYTVH